MAILKKLYILVFPLILTSCYEDFNPKIDTDPVLCLNSLITAGNPIEVRVSHTWLYTDDDGRNDHSVSDARIDIFANGELVEADYIPQEGDRIRIHASSLKYGEAEAEVTVPVATRVSDTDFTVKIDDIWMLWTEGWGLNAKIEFGIRMLMDLADNGDTDDFHRLTYQTFSGDVIMTDGYDSDTSRQNYGRTTYSSNLSEGQFEALDPVFYEFTDPFEDVMYGSYYTMFFSDRLFNGTAKTLTFGFSPCFFTLSGWKGDPEALECGWDIRLYTISESYYNWLAYSDRSSGIIFGDFEDFGMADPIWGYSNVSTGAGVVAAQSSVDVRVDLKNVLKKILEEENTDS